MKLVNKIQLQQQEKNDCSVVCVAMVTGKPTSYVKELYHKINLQYGSKAETIRILCILGVYAYPEPYCVLKKDEVYIAGVKPVGEMDILHNVVIDTRGDTPLVFDPAGVYTSIDEFYVLDLLVLKDTDRPLVFI